MEMRYLKRENENGQEERFYPVTHAKAIVYGDDDKAILNNLEAHLDDTNNPHGTQLTHLGVIATATELNYIDGVTSNIQTQLDGKAASGHTHTASDVGAVSTSRTVNGKALSSDITLSASDVGAAAASHGNHVSYGTSTSALGTASAGTASTVSRSDHVHALPALTSCTGTLSVAKGGTGATTFTSGAALIGAGTGAVTTRAITDNTSSAVASGTNLATCNTINNHVVNRQNRTNSVNAANTSYTTFMSRGIALNTAVPSSLTNGCATFVYA